MKRNVMPCLVLAAIMASSSLPPVYAQEKTSNTTSETIVSEDTENDNQQEDESQNTDNQETESDAPSEPNSSTDGESGENNTQEDADNSDDNENAGNAEDTEDADNSVSQPDEDTDNTDNIKDEIGEDNGEDNTELSPELPEDTEITEEPEEELPVEEQSDIPFSKDFKSTSTISVRVRMDYHMTRKQVEKQNITMQVQKIGDSQVYTADTISYSYIDANGNPCDDNDTVAAVDMEISGLSAGTSSDVYKVTVTGDGYRTYTYEKLSLAEYAQHITIGTADSTFTLGDVTSDNAVTDKDLKVVQSALGTSNTKHDLNKDGTVNIIDIAYVNRNMLAEGSGKAIAINGARVPSALVQNITAPKMEGVTIGEEEDFADLFKEDGEVTFTATETISPENPLDIPIEFTEAMDFNNEHSTLQVTIPSDNIDAEDVQILLYEDGEDGPSEILKPSSANNFTPAAAPLQARTNENTIVVNLGNRKAVKKISIRVTKTADGNTATIKQVEFVEDTVSKVPDKEPAKPKNLKATAGHQSVTLSWDKMANVGGYTVYYGTKQNELSETPVSTTTNSVTIDGLENLQTYFFAVAANSTTDDGSTWTSPKSEVISATPQPSKKPVAPTTLQIEPMDRALRFSWAKTENAVGYVVYYREKGTTQETRSDVKDATSITVGNLENGKTYEFSVEAYNSVGTSPRSVWASGTPIKQNIGGPELPALNRIDNNVITVSSSSGALYNVDKTQAPNFEASHVLDNDYATFWQSGAYWKDQSFTFDFETPQTMNYMIYVPRQGDISYTNGMRDYNITTYRKTSDGKYEEIDTYKSPITQKVTNDGVGYLVLAMPEANDISRVKVEVGQWEGAKAVTLSEAAFYHLDNVPNEVAALFNDGTFSTLANSPEDTKVKVAELRERIDNSNAFYLDKDILLKELETAEQIANGKQIAVTEGFQSRSAANDNEKFGQIASDLQPIGVTAESGKNILVYASIPEGETVTLIPTQYFAETNAWKGDGIVLQNGRNVINIEQISSVAPQKGGALYLTYSGSDAAASQIKLRVEGGTKTPTLELSNWYTLSDTRRKEKIKQYVTELDTYISETRNLTETDILNHTDISTPSVLLSLPASEVKKGLGDGIEAMTDKLYNAILAWEDVSYVVNTTQGIQGISDTTVKPENYQYPMESRQNIRYMRMFGNAFMYAAGNHIGVGFGSSAGLVQGEPASEPASTHKTGETNGLYGWGIAHEIGHNMDKLGKAEITNNLYSLMVQSYDGDNMTTFKTRLETDNRYDAIFQKTAEARPGSANDVFVQLGMYWQLHLAYDDADNPMNFYNAFFKKWKNGDYKDGNDYDNRVALIASEVVGKNLTEFFTRWGMELSESTKSKLSSYNEESRAIWYMNDDSRRNRINGKGVANGTVALDDVTVAPAETGQDVTLKFSHTNAENILGYEILKNGKSIGFTTENTYTENIGTANNTVLSYSVRAVDKQGNISAPTEAKDVRISYDNILSSDVYTLTADGTNVTITMNENKPHAISGIKLTGTGVTGAETITATITSQVDIKPEEDTKPEEDVKPSGPKETKLTLTQNMATEENTFKAYLTKPDAEPTDSRIWTYDATQIVLNNVPEGATVELIDAVNDDVAFLQNGAAIGRLKEAYQWGETQEEVIPAGSLVIIGTYVGEPQYNYVQVNGEFTTRDLETGTEEKVVRPINGDTYTFAEIPTDGEVSLISNGLFIYVVKEKAEADLNNNDCDKPSALPDRIQAVMYRTDKPNTAEGGRITSKTMWISSPAADGMPDIILKQN